MRFLRVLGFGRIGTRIIRHVLVPKRLADMPANRTDCFFGHRDAIGSHVGDQTDRLTTEVHALIKLLGRTHRCLRAHAKLAGGFLLKRRGREWRRWIALRPFALDRANGELTCLYDVTSFKGQLLVIEIELVKFVTAQMGKARLKSGFRRSIEPGSNGPVFLRLENLDLGFTLTNEAERYGLHTASTLAAR